ncbi:MULTISPECIES: HlyD family type I secretion periplasmic adaptor subunit [unclassified Agarivorans]|uniref:HlyD family type I secretion periplasmic adaptor subunit n=1 Tax=unclassified Agarivorans TaxID=2636026 RepID=UPI0026E47BFB|nr:MULTISPECIES: HlyD family type I secretion periplasmic adaptor subunit [unclassified Agarivorans]MDO6687927.1 HlyD family type I secretion periplasmic adaptor subunit [Agarivorans sp. 3_MG-2023]MDO6717549.1 HlyD family type I secretion periplasmic adaptor subunit [Agarivorans sp. 2_MG-2023]
MSKQRPDISEAELKFVDDINAAMLMKTPRRSRRLLWLIFVLLVSAISWAHWAQVDEVTIGNGKVIPSQQIQTIQNLEGGILKQILVREGEQVEPSQPLLLIDDTRFRSDFREQEQRVINLEGDVARLRSEIASIQLDPNLAFEQWQEQVKVTDVEIEFNDEFKLKYPSEVTGQQLQKTARLRALQNQLSITAGQIDQKQQEIVELKSKILHVNQSYNLVLEELKITKPLAEEGIVSQVEILKLRRQANDLKGELQSSKLLEPKIRSAIAETIYKRRDIALAFLSEARRELNQIEAELQPLSEGQVGLRDRVDRTSVVSPVKGTVKKIYINTVGGVVQPGMSIMEIVPIEDKLLVEAKIQPKDIAFLRPGLKTVVKFSAYDFSIYGGLDGRLEHISADTILDEEGNSYYLVRVRTDKNYLGTDDTPLPIIPGMLSSVDIITGKKSILDYLLKPIIKAQQSALRER